MEQRTLNFTVTGQHITSTNSIEDIVANTNGYLVAAFTLDALYSGMMTAAVFTAQGKNYILVLNSNNQVDIPREVLRSESFSVGVYAGAGEGIITTDTVSIPLSESVRTRFTLNKSYVELYTQLVQEFDEFVNGTTGILNEHIELSSEQTNGVHDLRIVNGVFQYFNHTLNQWVDASTGSVTGLIADNLTTTSPGLVLDARQGSVLKGMVDDTNATFKVQDSILKYKVGENLIPVAKKQEVDDLVTVKIYEEKTISAHSAGRVGADYIVERKFIILKTSTYKSSTGTVTRYSIYMATGSDQSERMYFMGGYNRDTNITTETIPAQGFNIVNGLDFDVKVRVCNIPYIDGM